MKKTILAVLVAFAASTLSAQSFNMTLNGSDTSHACSGTLYDNGGSSNNYSDYSNDYFYIEPSGGGTLTLTFTSLNMYHSSDRVYVYDGVGPTAILIGSYYFGLPAGGNPITMTSGKATIYFSSNYYGNSSGFALNWSAGSSAPVAQFNVSNPNPPVNVGITFTNTSSNGGELLWDFGDGSTSTSANPIHKYTSPGTYQAKLIATNCIGTDTSSVQNILVMANPVYTVNPDSLYASVNCGNTATQTFTVNQTGGGTMYYNISGRELGANPYALNEGFESGLGAFSISPSAASGFTAFGTIGGAAKGNGNLFASQYSGSFSGLLANIPASQPTEASYYVKFNNTTDRYGWVSLTDGTTSLSNRMYHSRVYNSYLYVYTNFGSYSYPINVGTWNFIEIKNINWTNKTFDLYINNVSVATSLGFYNPAMSQITTAHIFNESSGYNFYYDEFKIKTAPVSNLSISPSNGVLSASNSNTVTVSLPTSGKNAGQYEYEVLFKTNSSTADSLKVIPFVIDIVGIPTINTSSTCMDLDSVYVGYTNQDSLLIWNSGCSNLDLTSLTTATSDFTVSSSASQLLPGDSTYAVITFTPSSIGQLTDTLFIANSDTLKKICLSGKGLGLPDFSIDTNAINVTLVGCDDSVLVHKTIYNQGAGNLDYKISSVGQMELQEVLDVFKANQFSVYNLIPSRYSFSDGILYSYIPDGGGDMYDSGNRLSTNLNFSYLNYSNDLIIPNTNVLGGGGQYFTYKGPGIWLFAADIFGVSDFEISGNLGADGSGLVDAAVLTSSSNGTSYKGFVKRVYQAGDPSVNHLVIVENKGSLSHTYSTNTDSDMHTVSGLSNHTRIYYLLYAGSNGYYIDNNATQAIMNQFVSLIQGGGSANWVTASPDSARLAPADSTVLDIWIKSAGLQSGSYSTDVIINSNDPMDSTVSISVNLSVQGASEINVPGCRALGGVMNGLIVVDTVPVWNTGCDSLLLTGTSSTSSDITGSIVTTSIAPGDTGWVEVTFAPSAIAAYNDTLFVQSNDTVAAICITANGLGAPDFAINPDSIYVSFTSCNDSITIPVTIKNNSADAGLVYKIEGLSNSGKRKILAYLPQYRSYEYSNLKNQILLDPDNLIIEEFNSSMTILQGHLDTVNEVLIPESYSNTFFWSQVSAVLKPYVDNGGTVILMAQYSSTYTNLDLIPGFSSSNYLYTTLYNTSTSHPIMQGVSASFPYVSNTTQVSFTGAGQVLLSQYTNTSLPSVVSVHEQGRGKVIHLGFDFYNSSSPNVNTILHNALSWGATSELSDYITITPDSGAVATSDSVVINVTIHSQGLQNGTYQDQLVVTSNDPLHLETIIPVVINVSGLPEISLDASGCTSFVGVLQGATETDTILVANTGCDTLDITGFTGSTTEFAVAGLPMSLAPGDSIPLQITFTPLTVGTFSDTLTLLNTDTAVTICVNGTSAGAPVLSAKTDTLEVELNKCNVIKNVNYSLGNSGLGTMSYGITIGDFSGVSQIPYNTSGATTNHIFNGVPSSDTLLIKVILKGDFDDYYERAYLRIDNYNYSYVYDNNKPNHTLDTVEFLIWGNNVQNWTSDGTLDISLQNQFDVDGSSGSFHRVEIFLPAQINWASIVGTSTGNVGAGASVNKSILFNAATLGVGTYHTTMNITTNSPGSPKVAVPLKLNVVTKPEIALSDSCLYYPLTLVGDTSVRELTVYNNGCASLNVSSLLPSNSAFKISPSSGNIPVGDSLKVTINFVPTLGNFYNASLIINSNDSVKVICLVGSGGVMPTAGFGISHENTCQGEVAFINTSSNGSTYNWNMGDGNFYTTANVTHFYTKPGTYSVVLKVTNSAGVDTITQLVTVNPLFVDFSMSNDTILKGAQVNFYDSSITAIAWRWNFGDGTTANVQNPSNTYNIIGKYQITLEVDDANNCTRYASKDLYVVNHIGLEEELLESLKYTIYPNPSTGKFTIESINTNLTEVTLVVSDLNGKEIWRANGSTRSKTEIDLSKFSKGMYTLSLVKEGRTLANKKLIVN